MVDLSGVPELEWHIVSVAMLRMPGRLRSIGDAVDSDEDFRPTIAARTFPPRRRLKGAFADWNPVFLRLFEVTQDFAARPLYGTPIDQH